MELSERYLQAYEYAYRLHARQKRKVGDVPYITHLMTVSALVMEYGGGEDEAIGALLHDAVEDQGGLPVLSEIRARFGANVAEIVMGCTDDSYKRPKPPWRETKQAYVARLESASASIHLVSSADKLHNVRTILQAYRRIGEDVWKAFSGNRKGSLWYYRALADAFTRLGRTPVAPELQLAVSELERLSAAAATA